LEPDRPIDPPSLLVLTPEVHETQYILQLTEIHLGRDAHCTVPLARRGVSRRHAMICIDDGKATVRDLGSTNGTLLNGKPLGEDPEPLSDGDCLTISKIEIRYIEPAAHSGEEVERDDSLVTQLGTVLAAGTLGTMLAD
jgi:pSer/pThr/pTyr-binding forkhead associated (FHA) protein